MTQPSIMDQLAADAADEDKADGVASASITDLGEELASLKNSITEAEQVVSDLKARHKEVSVNILPDAMREAGLVGANGKGGFTLESGGRVHLRQNLNASCPKVHQEAFHAWLEENGHGALIRPTVHPQTLKAFVKEQRAQGSEVPEHLLSIFDETAAVAVKS